MATSDVVLVQVGESSIPSDLSLFGYTAIDFARPVDATLGGKSLQKFDKQNGCLVEAPTQCRDTVGPDMSKASCVR